MALITGESSRADFQENDVQLLRTGNLADATIKCKGRAWKVHRTLLSSRLKFFHAAFYGKFSEATSGEVDFPEADPDSIDIMLRHLYGDGTSAAVELQPRAQLTTAEGLNVQDLKTPILCVRSWKLADYMQLDTLKAVSMTSLNDHLNAMTLLATNGFLEEREPKWLSHFFSAFQEVCADVVTTPLRDAFVAFLWISKFEMGILPQTLDMLEKYPEVNKELLQLLIRNKCQNEPSWLGYIQNIQSQVRNRQEIPRPKEFICSQCRVRVDTCDQPMFHNPFPVGQVAIGQLNWCKMCVENFNGHRRWPWESGREPRGGKVEVEVWSLFDGKEGRQR